jgi:hypothetical protein
MPEHSDATTRADSVNAEIERLRAQVAELAATKALIIVPASGTRRSRAVRAADPRGPDQNDYDEDAVRVHAHGKLHL